MLLAAMNWPDDWQASLALDLWGMSEGLDASWHNPLAATYLHGIGDHACSEPLKLPDGSRNVDHVSSCPTYQSWVAAMVEFFGQSYYNEIDNAFHAPMWKGKMENIFLAINGSPWSPHAQGGKYPIALYNYLHGHSADLPSPVLIPGEPPKPVPEPVNIFTAWHDLMLQLRYTVPRELRRMRNARKIMRNAVK